MRTRIGVALSFPAVVAIGSCVSAPPPPPAPSPVPVVVQTKAPAPVPRTAPTDSVVVPPESLAVAPPESLAVAPPPIPREFRAAWVSPLYGAHGADWPSRPGLPPDSQRAELRALLDRAQAIGLNALILHVRIAADALYPSPYAPWSSLLTGRAGQNPGYDPLSYAVEQAHERGLQLHAWFNPFRARIPGVRAPEPPSHVTRAHPRWVRRYGSQTWIDPGDPAARQFVLATILDVVKRYAVDGVHIDDYFYPYRESQTLIRRRHHRRVRIRRDIPFPDDRTWVRYGRARGWTDRDAWRRANIDDFVHALYTGVKAIRPTVLVGISPFGIWRSGTPPGVTGLDAYGEIYADSRRWLREGWLDYVVPQLYWPLDGAEQRFARLDAWWMAENVRGRHVWPGLETEMTMAQYDPWPAAEIGRQIAQLRSAQDDDDGHVHFRLGSLGTGAGSLGERLETSLYDTTALVPASPWLDDRAPAPPRVAQADSAGREFSVQSGDSVPVAWWVVQARTSDGRWSTTVLPSTRDHFALAPAGGRDFIEIAVTAVGRTGESSSATVIPRSLSMVGGSSR